MEPDLLDSHPYRRRLALHALSDSASLRRAIPLLEDPVPQVREEAIRTLRPLGAEAVPAVLPRLEDYDTAVRSEAALFLARWEDGTSRGALENRYRLDPSFRVRGAIARGWGEGRRADRIPLLQERIDPNDHVSFLRSEALSRLGVPSPPNISAAAEPILLLSLLLGIVLVLLRRPPWGATGIALALPLFLFISRGTDRPIDPALARTSWGIVPLGEVRELPLIVAALREATGRTYPVLPAQPLPAGVRTHGRGQVQVHRLLAELRIAARSFSDDTPGRLVFVTEEEIYPIGSYATAGYSPSPGGVVVVSLARIRPEQMDGAEVPGLLAARLRKVLRHEIGHNLGLLHEGHEGACAMEARSLLALDVLPETFCARCRAIAADAIPASGASPPGP